MFGEEESVLAREVARMDGGANREERRERLLYGGNVTLRHGGRHERDFEVVEVERRRSRVRLEVQREGGVREREIERAGEAHPGVGGDRRVANHRVERRGVRAETTLEAHAKLRVGLAGSELCPRGDAVARAVEHDVRHVEAGSAERRLAVTREQALRAGVR